jgi:hypothetical protein
LRRDEEPLLRALAEAESELKTAEEIAAREIEALSQER